MNKAELVGAICDRTGNTRTTVDTILSATVEVIMGQVAQGAKVTLVGFGTFESRDAKARAGRNPKTGEPMTIPARTKPAFRPGTAFKERVNDG